MPLNLLPPSPPYLVIEHDTGSAVSEAAALRPVALDLIEASELRAALPLFEAISALQQTTHSGQSGTT